MTTLDPGDRAAAHTGSVSTDRLQRNSLGVMGIVFFVVGAAAPLLVMAGVAPLAIGIVGVGAPAGYLIAGLALLVFAVAFTAMSQYVHNAGAFYAYICQGLGQRWGMGAAFVALFSYNALEIGIFGALGYFAQTTFADLFSVDLPWPVWAVAGIALVWFLGSRSVHAGARVLATLLIAETGILVLLAVSVMARGGAEGLTVTEFAPDNVFAPGMGAVLALAFAAFIGFEATAIYREEAVDPQRTIPRATYLAVGFLGVFYAFMVWVIIQAYGQEGALEMAATNPAGMYFEAIEVYVGSWARTAMELLIITSVLASLLAFHNSITRYTYTLAREGVLPRSLAQLHRVHKSPAVASAAQSVLALVVVLIFAAVGADPYLQLLLWVNSAGIVGILVLQAMAALAVFAFFRSDRRGHSVWRVRVAPLVAVVLLLGGTYLIASQMELLTAAGTGVNALLIALTPVFLALGYVVAARIQRRDPERYAMLGLTDVDAEDAEAAA